MRGNPEILLKFFSGRSKGTAAPHKRCRWLVTSGGRYPYIRPYALLSLPVHKLRELVAVVDGGGRETEQSLGELSRGSGTPIINIGRQAIDTPRRPVPGACAAAEVIAMHATKPT